MKLEEMFLIPSATMIKMNCLWMMHSDNDIIDLTLDLTVDDVVGLEGDNDEEEKSTPLTGKLIQEGLQLCSKLENLFLINALHSE
ncbi:hypothetical protein TNCV_3928661 [Trichonephila clavipes]|nr:hypothetical protein TNCV_3928661 [Trichonephila clavipes]